MLAELYDKIAADHVYHYKRFGKNPFQQADAVRAHEDATVELFEKWCPERRWVLDAGCGMGDLLLRIPGVGVEIAEPYLEVSRERGLEVQQGRIEDLPFEDEDFDVVICTDVLEHVVNIHAAVEELLRVLKDGGHIIVRVPDSEWVGKDERYGFVHLRILDEGTIRALFEVVFGCEVLDCFSADDVVHCVAQKC